MQYFAGVILLLCALISAGWTQHLYFCDADHRLVALNVLCSIGWFFMGGAYFTGDISVESHLWTAIYALSVGIFCLPNAPIYFRGEKAHFKQRQKLEKKSEELRRLNESAQMHHEAAKQQAIRDKELAEAKRLAEFADIGREATEMMRPDVIDLVKAKKQGQIERWSRLTGQNGGLAKVDSGFDYAANFSSVACVA